MIVLLSLILCIFSSTRERKREHWVAFLFLFKILFIYLTDRDHKKAKRQAEREGEAGSLLSREPDVGIGDSGTSGLDPRTLRP